MTESQRITGAECARIIDLYKQVGCTAKVARVTGRSQSTVWRVVKRSGVPMPPPVYVAGVVDVDAITRVKEWVVELDWTYQDVADEAGVSRSTVQHFMDGRPVREGTLSAIVDSVTEFMESL